MQMHLWLYDTSSVGLFGRLFPDFWFCVRYWIPPWLFWKPETWNWGCWTALWKWGTSFCAEQFPQPGYLLGLNQVVSEQNCNLCGSVHSGDFSLAHTQLFYPFLFLSWLTLAVSSKRSKMEETKASSGSTFPLFEGGSQGIFPRWLHICQLRYYVFNCIDCLNFSLC